VSSTWVIGLMLGGLCVFLAWRWGWFAWARPARRWVIVAWGWYVAHFCRHYWRCLLGSSIVLFTVGWMGWTAGAAKWLWRMWW
jgi:hypothetical protein